MDTMKTPPTVTPEEWEDSPKGYPQSPPYSWWRWHDAYGADGDDHEG